MHAQTENTWIYYASIRISGFFCRFNRCKNLREGGMVVRAVTPFLPRSLPKDGSTMHPSESLDAAFGKERALRAVTPFPPPFPSPHHARFWWDTPMQTHRTRSTRVSPGGLREDEGSHARRRRNPRFPPRARIGKGAGSLGLEMVARGGHPVAASKGPQHAGAR